MSDETGDNTEVKPEVKPEVRVEGEGEDQKIVIGDVELSPDEAKDLVTQGKNFKELSEEYPDINFKELPRSFTQTKQELAEIKKSKEEPGEVDEKEIARLKQIDDFFDDPQVQKRLTESSDKMSKAIKEDSEFQKVTETLQKEYDGSDGRPKFNLKEVLEYGTKHQIFNPKVAYGEMHKKELDEWMIKEAMGKKRPSTFFEKKGGTGSKQPDPKSPTTFKEATQAAMEE